MLHDIVMDTEESESKVKDKQLRSQLNGFNIMQQWLNVTLLCERLMTTKHHETHLTSFKIINCFLYLPQLAALAED